MSKVLNCKNCGNIAHTQDDIYGKGNRLHTTKPDGTVKNCTVCGPERHRTKRMWAPGPNPVMGVQFVELHQRGFTRYPWLDKIK